MGDQGCRWYKAGPSQRDASNGTSDNTAQSGARNAELVNIEVVRMSTRMQMWKWRSAVPQGGEATTGDRRKRRWRGLAQASRTGTQRQERPTTHGHFRSSAFDLSPLDIRLIKSNHHQQPHFLLSIRCITWQSCCISLLCRKRVTYRRQLDRLLASQTRRRVERATHARNMHDPIK